MKNRIISKQINSKIIKNRNKMLGKSKINRINKISNNKTQIIDNPIYPTKSKKAKKLNKVSKKVNKNNKIQSKNKQIIHKIKNSQTSQASKKLKNPKTHNQNPQNKILNKNKITEIRIVSNTNKKK